MRKLTRDDWIEAGLNNLDLEGHSGVSAERVARRLNVTRGSFYHHFCSREDFVRALLSAWEQDYTERMLDYAAQGAGPTQVLKRYIHIAADKQPNREVAIRAWALHDPVVAEYQTRVDARRLAFAISTSKSAFLLPKHSEIVGEMVHLCFIGGQQSGVRHNAARFANLLGDALALFRPRSRF
ncbi:TetR/AcrR family transcriptional regulator [Alcaligenes nematophilus]|uniref:TetR/AcrR family transcriptional regulator n=1 Tax=Alcaligenes nematophilus TaxID=2994643 RepID=A0ABU3MU80_9BURK|nr:TetR/AcrR family transcriptional regulator [Alcaligenes nematophilus]MCX5472540.1 TetR/AcrR family transcriptional regulator [Alcaligenes nematophilus]MDT8469526.1 TetR/AcrR family transcriptional regulator [Alcaligenes nematophilus]MDT8505328.1 TetR/AcrR family transcriptional regulator [Alcaligenes nematophilus]MDT8524301.1 TetR/AcrR family transcriptional regulator [Alcaligenes nematophilus]